MKKDNNNWKKLLMTLAVLLVLSASGIATTTIRDGAVSEFFGINTGNITTSGYILPNDVSNRIKFYDTDDSDNTTLIDIISTSGSDGYGGEARTGLQFYSAPDLNSLNNYYRALGISTHMNGSSQPYHVTFYSNLKNSSGGNGKAFEWFWKDDNVGKFYLRNLNKIEFPENFTGYYDDIANTGAGINSLDENFTINLDQNGNDATQNFMITKDTTPVTLFQVSDTLVKIPSSLVVDTDTFFVKHSDNKVGIGTITPPDKFSIVLSTSEEINIRRSSDSLGATSEIGLIATAGSGSTPEMYIGFNRTNIPGTGDGDFIVRNTGLGTAFTVKPNGNITLGDGDSRTCMTLTSPDLTEYTCCVANGGAFSCS